MGRELYETAPLFRAALNHCDELLQPYLDVGLLDLLFSQETDRAEEGSDRLNQTAYTQPTLFAIEYALAQLWISWGIKPSIVMGHSIGEYVAACIAGVFSLEDGLKLVTARGQLMQALPDNGMMIAVMADESTVQGDIQRAVAQGEIDANDVAIAAINGPLNTVISGECQTLNRLAERWSDEGIKTKALQVSHAFHSQLMQPMLAAFSQVAAEVIYAPPKIDLISNITGHLTRADIATPEYWCLHIVQPVRFMEGLKTLAEQNNRVYLEVGPNPVLNAMGQQFLEGSNFWATSLWAGRSDWEQLLQNLAVLYTYGCAIDWQNVEPHSTNPSIKLPTYPFQRQRYWWDANELAVNQRVASPINTDHIFTPTTHPLLGARLNLAGAHEQRFQTQLRANHPSFLQHHQVVDVPVFPATGYIEQAIAAAVEMLGSQSLQLSNLAIEAPLSFSDAESQNVQVVIVPEKETADRANTYQWKIYSCSTPTAESPAAWTRHASGLFGAAPPAQTTPAAVNIAGLQLLHPQKMNVPKFYQQLQEQGLAYGDSFQGIAELWQGQQQVLSQLKMPPVLTSRQQYQLHPALLDAALQGLAALVQPSQPGLYLPVAIKELILLGPVPDNCWSHIQLRTETDQQLQADIDLWDQSGTLVAKIAGLSLQFATHRNLRRLLIPQQSLEQWLYEILWVSKPLPLAPAPSPWRRARTGTPCFRKAPPMAAI